VVGHVVGIHARGRGEGDAARPQRRDINAGIAVEKQATRQSRQRGNECAVERVTTRDDHLYAFGGNRRVPGELRRCHQFP
jgi:hypothetical protein